MLNPDTILQNRYRIIAPLGQGGMGAVYKAIDQRLSLNVALKETLADTDELRRAFEREARLLANLNHPSLPRVIDHFIEDKGQYLVMDYVPNDDLGAMLSKRGNPFPVDEVMFWASDLLEVLDYLHKHEPQIIHRDIKPNNIKVSAKGKIILLDFGLAKGKAGEMTKATLSQSVLGYSLYYASLEQIQGDKTSERSDLYSLAVTLYNLLTGIKPPDALTRAAAVFNDEPDPLIPIQQLVPSLPNQVSETLMSGAALKPASRPKSAKEMLLRLSGDYKSIPSTQHLQEREEETVVRYEPNFELSESRKSSNVWIYGTVTLVLVIAICLGIYFFVNLSKPNDSNKIEVAQVIQTPSINNSANSENSNTPVGSNVSVETPTPFPTLDKKKAQRMIRQYISNEGGDTEFRVAKIHYGDLDNDGDEDAVTNYTVFTDEIGHFSVFLAAFRNNNGILSFADKFWIGGSIANAASINIIGIKRGKINAFTALDEEGREGRKNTQFYLKGNKLMSVGNKNF